jgi:hypothetical protein
MGVRDFFAVEREERFLFVLEGEERRSIPRVEYTVFSRWRALEILDDAKE